MHSSDVSETTQENNHSFFRDEYSRVKHHAYYSFSRGSEKEKLRIYVYVLFKEMAIILMGKMLTADGAR